MHTKPEIIEKVQINTSNKYSWVQKSQVRMAASVPNYVKN